MQDRLLASHSDTNEIGVYAAKLGSSSEQGWKEKSNLIMSSHIYPTVHFPTTCSTF